MGKGGAAKASAQAAKPVKSGNHATQAKSDQVGGVNSPKGAVEGAAVPPSRTRRKPAAVAVSHQAAEPAVAAGNASHAREPLGALPTATPDPTPVPAPVVPLPEKLAEPIADFGTALLLERGRSERTLEAYEHDLQQCAAVVARAGATDWAQVTAAQVEAWLHGLEAGAYRASSQARKLSALRMFARYLVRERVRPDDFTALLTGPKRVRPLPGTLNGQEIAALLAAPQGGDAFALRDRALLELFYSSGLRVSELAGLTLQQINLEDGFLRVLGKGAKERVVPVGGRAVQAVQRYLEAGRTFFVRTRTGSQLFLSERGTALSRQMLWVLVKKYAQRASITQGVKPHLLRHSFATHLLGGGADLRSIQEMLGHANIVTTQIYTSVDGTRLVEEHAKYHPRKEP